MLKTGREVLGATNRAPEGRKKTTNTETDFQNGSQGETCSISKWGVTGTIQYPLCERSYLYTKGLITIINCKQKLVFISNYA